MNKTKLTFAERLIKGLEIYFHNRKMIQRTKNLTNLMCRAAVGAASVDRLEVFKAQMTTWAHHNPYDEELKKEQKEPQ